MKTIVLYLLFALIPPEKAFKLIINRDTEVVLQKNLSIAYPDNIEVTSEENLPVEVILSSGSRKIWQKESRTNKTITIFHLSSIEYLIVKVKDKDGAHIYRLKIIN